MSGSGIPYIYRPHDVFTAMGCCWVLEDEFSYPIDSNLRNSMPRDTIDELHRALNHIKKENYRIKIRHNRYQTQVKIRELMECKLYEQAQYMQSLLAADIYQSDVKMSDEE
nr:hypothetical protein CFP56_49674 [Quercus suber]